MGNFLSRDDILAVPLRTLEVEVPEWGGTVLIREMTAAEVQENGRYLLKPNGKPDFSKAVQVPTRMCARQIVDENGERLFGDADISLLMERHGAAISNIAKAVRELSGMEEGRITGRWWSGWGRSIRRCWRNISGARIRYRRPRKILQQPPTEIRLPASPAAGVCQSGSDAGGNAGVRVVGVDGISSDRPDYGRARGLPGGGDCGHGSQRSPEEGSPGDEARGLYAEIWPAQAAERG